MFRNKWVVVLALMALALPVAAVASAAGWSISVLGGTGIPMGDFADQNLADAQSGWQAGAMVDYALNDMWSLGVDGSFVKNTHGAEGKTINIGGGETATYTSDKFTTMQFGVHAMATLPGSGPIRFHGLLGLGTYSTKEKWEGSFTSLGSTITDNGESDNQSGLGGRIGVGAMYAMSPMFGIGVDADYNMVSEDKDKVGFSSLQYVGVNGVVRYKIPMGGAK